jgi:hypothetical protein
LEGAVLRIGADRDIAMTTKVVMWVPTEFLNITEASKILQLLKTQNVGLKTEEWKIVNSRVAPLGVTLVLDIDKISLKALVAWALSPTLVFLS